MISSIVYTNSQRQSMLSDTITSIERGGFRKPAVLTDDGDYGAWKMLQMAVAAGAVEAIRNNDVMCGVFQDDILLCENVVGLFGDEISRLTASGKLVSLFTSAGNHVGVGGWNAVKVPSRAYGAQAYVFSVDMALKFVETAPVGQKHLADHWVGVWCHKQGVEYVCHSPSLVLHIGDGDSTIGGNAGVSWFRNCQEWLAYANKTKSVGSGVLRSRD